ncbi:glycosyltransferase family 2 protein [bacterium]|nr:MAG: glycosyltransferase family 2 protein [bacterium]
MNPSPLVSVVILNYNGKKFIKSLFDSLSKTTYPSVEWIMVDNASMDDSVAYTEQHYPQVMLIRSDANLGYTGGNNLGIAAAQGKYIVLLNNDVEVAPDWLDHLVNEAEKDETVGALQPKLQSMINRGYFEYAGASGGFIDQWGFAFLRGRMFDTIETDRGQYDDIREIFWASGAALFLRRSALDEAGTLDETFFMHYEEIDLCWRLHLHGYIVKVIPQSNVLHYVSASLPAADFKKLYWNHRNSLILLIKNLPARRLFLTLLQRFILDGIAGIHALVQFEPMRIVAILNAHFWVYAHALVLLKKRRLVQINRKVTDAQFRHLIYPKSIVFDYFLKKKKEFHTLGF